MTATASSYYSNSYLPSMAIDVSTNTSWFTRTYQAANSYFQVDFDTLQIVSGITIDWYSSSTSMTRGRVDIYDLSGNNIYSVEADFTGSTSQLSIPSVQNARQLRLTAISTASNTYVSIREFSVDKTDMPTNGELDPSGTNINTSIGADTTVSIFIKDRTGNIIRKLVDSEYRAMGSYSDYWDVKDDNGQVANDGVYYAILEYIVDGQVKTLDLTNSTGGSQFTPKRDRVRSSFSPYDDDFLDIHFRLNRPAEVTLFVGILWSINKRVRTILNRVPMPAGNHTVYWDGLDDEENIAHPPPGNSLILGLWGYTLSDNAIYVTGGRPVITDVTADPNYFNPLDKDCNGNTKATVSYNLSEAVSTVSLKVYSLSTGALVRTVTENNVMAGVNTISWYGKNNTGSAVDEGDYQLGIVATDPEGNKSMMMYSLVRLQY